MVKWVNLNRNNRSVTAYQHSALSEKARPVLLPLVNLTAGWLAGLAAGLPAGWLTDEMRVDFKNFKILYRSNYLYFYFV